MTNFDQLRLENQLCHVIYSASNALARFYKPHLEKLDLTYPQYLVMLALWEEEGVNIHSISKLTFFDSGSLTPLIQKLKQKEFIEINPDPQDRRKKIIRLTKRGQQLKRKATRIPEILSCVMPFKAQEIEQFKSLVRSLHQAIVQHENEG